MSTLSELNCVACNKHEQLLTQNQIEVLLSDVLGWEIITEGGIQKLTRQFEKNNYQESILFTNAVAKLAEATNHHPQIILEYSCVTVVWWSHILNGLHKNDFIMAAKTSNLF